jgi:hypothetical protein
MILTLEALHAKHGDSLLLHYGDTSNPQLIVIDGGPAGVFGQSLKPRLDQLKARRTPDGSLPIRLLMVSHLDDDHINGVLSLTDRLVDMKKDQQALPYKIGTLWHNSFDDLLGTTKLAAFESASVAVASVPTDGAVPTGLPISRPAALVLASVGQGRKLRDNAKALSLKVNAGVNEKLVMAPAKGKKQVKLDGLELTVIGPNKQRVTELQKNWDAELKKHKWAADAKGRARAAAYVDDSVYNLSSIVVLAKAGDKTMLLTGDARGDDILTGLKSSGLLKNDTLHVDLLKLPHHGSDRNVETDFFRRVTADHYVISADGKHGNPEVATLKMISEAREDDEYQVSLTNKEDRLVRFFSAEKERGKKYQAAFRDPSKLSISIDLGTSLP